MILLLYNHFTVTATGLDVCFLPVSMVHQKCVSISAASHCDTCFYFELERKSGTYMVAHHDPELKPISSHSTTELLSRKYLT